MNVLEIYPNFAWWLDAPDAVGIDALRAAALLNDLHAQSEALEKLEPRHAYYLVGDAATFDLVREVFDHVVLRYQPTALKRLVLDRRMRQWVAANGEIRYEPTSVEILEPHATFDASLPAKLARLRRW